MAVTDPVDARLLAALAEVGKTAVHELAAKVGMDPREVAYRLVALSGSGLPLLVGVESDPNGLRAALVGGAGPRPPVAPQPNVAGTPSGRYPVHAPPPQQQWPGAQGVPSGAPAVQGVPSGAYTVQGGPSGAHTAQGAPGGPHTAQGAPGSHAVQGVPSGAYTVHGVPSGPHTVQGGPTGAHTVHGTPSGRYQPPAPPRPPQVHRPPAPPADPVMSTWGPPQSASWARGDQPPSAGVPAGKRTGKAGEVLETQGLEGERLALQLLEVQDPADFLFSAAGYRLEPGERAVVVHTEITNRGQIPFASLPDNYLELLTAEGKAIGKAPVSLSSRPPHRIGVQPGETAGGHTVYVLPEATRVVSVRWNARPEVDERSLTWSIED